jgi:hypothetical protein
MKRANFQLPTNNLMPSGYLDVSVTEDQASLFNPTMGDLLLATIEEEAYGEHAKQKRARRRMDIIDGNAKSYARHLNNNVRLQRYTEYNGLQAVLSALRSEQDEKRAKSTEDKKQKQAEKQHKKAHEEVAKKEKEKELLPVLELEMGKGIDHIMTQNVPRLKEILIYYFRKPRKDIKSLKSQELKDAIRKEFKPPPT